MSTGVTFPRTEYPQPASDSKIGNEIIFLSGSYDCLCVAGRYDICWEPLRKTAKVERKKCHDRKQIVVGWLDPIPARSRRLLWTGEFP